MSWEKDATRSSEVVVAKNGMGYGEDAPEVQVFAVDTWRGRMYADAMVKLAVEKLPHADGDSVRKKAYADFLIRSTLAVAATLTRGDLPVFGRLYSDKSHVGLE